MTNCMDDTCSGVMPGMSQFNSGPNMREDCGAAKCSVENKKITVAHRSTGSHLLTNLLALCLLIDLQVSSRRRTGDRFDQYSIDERRRPTQTHQSPHQWAVALGAIVDGAGDHRTYDATPHIKKAHAAANFGEIITAEKVADCRPGNRKKSFDDGEEHQGQPELRFRPVRKQQVHGQTRNDHTGGH